MRLLMAHEDYSGTPVYDTVSYGVSAEHQLWAWAAYRAAIVGYRTCNAFLALTGVEEALGPAR